MYNNNSLNPLYNSFFRFEHTHTHTLFRFLCRSRISFHQDLISSAQSNESNQMYSPTATRDRICIINKWLCSALSINPYLLLLLLLLLPLLRSWWRILVKLHTPYSKGGSFRLTLAHKSSIDFFCPFKLRAAANTIKIKPESRHHHINFSLKIPFNLT